MSEKYELRPLVGHKNHAGMARYAKGKGTVFHLKILTVTAILVILTAMLIHHQKRRVGVDWEHLRFMTREEQGPIAPEAPRGFVWYEVREKWWI